MRQELDEKLCAKYPKIFVNRHGDKMKTLMCWGFSCGDGWYWLIDRLCSNLQWNTDHNNQPQIVAVQVKEKFGGLRFYVESASPEQYAVISFAESLSYGVCEECGSPHNIGRTSGWIRTLCETCAGDNETWTKKEE